MRREPVFLQRLFRMRHYAATMLVLNLATFIAGPIFALYFTGPEPKWFYLTVWLVICGVLALKALKIYLTEKRKRLDGSPRP